jgi:flavin-binding protein dodecin
MASVARVTQISARSETGIEDAVRVGLSRAGASLRGVEGAWVKAIKVDCADGAITSWQVTLEVTFVLDD